MEAENSKDKRRKEREPGADIGPEEANQVDIETGEQGQPDYEAGNADIQPNP